MAVGEPVSPDEAAALLSPWTDPGGPATGLLLAVSGGPDSVALMRLAAGLRASRPCVPLFVATVDHGLRPESAAEAAQVGAWSAECGLPCHMLVWTGEKPRTGVQEAARQARYLLLAGCACENGASHVATAHTLDDQAETIVMRLVRGSGVAGLAGMKGETKLDGATLARPFLGMRKSRIESTCRENGWPFLVDPSNAMLDFTRVRLRHDIMPLLAQAGLTPERAAVLAARARRTEEALEARASRVLDAIGRVDGAGRIELDGQALLDEPDAIRLAVIARCVAAVTGPNSSAPRLDRLENLVLGELAPVLAADTPLRRTLGGALIAIRPGRRVRIAREGPRGKPLLRSS